MKSFPFFLLTAVACAQSLTPPATAPAPPLPANAVVATFGNGEKITAGEVRMFISAMPSQMAQSALRDRKAFVQQFALMHKLAELAEEAKLDQRSPTKESLAFNRMYLLMNAQLHDMMDAVTVPPADMEAFYKQNPERFLQVKVKAIYVAFAGNTASDAVAGGKKPLTEAEARDKVQKLRAAVLAGANFVNLVKDNSDDQISAAKDGDFGTIRHNDKLPDAVRAAIFALKLGELSQPVKQPNGYYLFRAEEVSAQPFAEVSDEILSELKQARFKETMDQTVRSLNLKYENEAYFAAASDTK